MIHEINRTLLDTLAACGDVNRNVMCNPNPELSSLHAETLRLAKVISDHLMPRTRACHEIWIGDDLVAGGEPDHEPLYGSTYLLRKFKTVIAIPPGNDVDIYAHDLGFIAIADAAGQLSGFNGGVRFYDLFRNHVKKGGKVVSFFSGSTAQRLTSRQVAEELPSCGAEVNVVNRKRLFHAKCYGWESDKGNSLIVSSGNFTGPGMS